MSLFCWEINIQQGCIKLIRIDRKDISTKQRLFLLSFLLFELLFIIESWQMYHVGVQRIVGDPYGPDPTVRHACDSRVNC